MKRLRLVAVSALLGAAAAAAPAPPLELTVAEYEDRVHAAWLGQIVGTLAGFPFEGRVASSERVFVTGFPRKYDAAPVDDDYYYELVALRAFEKYGTSLTLDQLGEQWKENSAGTWGSSQKTRQALARGVPGSQAGHPRHNALWWTIGPQFSGDIYGLLAPGDPNAAGGLARTYGHINGYAEGTDGAVFAAGMVSLAFRETGPRAVVRGAAKLIHPSSPYRQCLDLVISLAEAGKSAEEVFRAVEDRWRMEYPPVNNAVANGGLLAASVWFGGGDYWKTVNLAFRAADFSDADCNAATAGGVVGAMHGTAALPRELVESLHDRIRGAEMGGVKLTPPVDESIADIARRTAALGRGMRGAKGDVLVVPWRAPETQPAEVFRLADLGRLWNPAWALERAGFGGVPAAGCQRLTFLDGDVLATWPRDESRGALFRRTLTPGPGAVLELEVAADKGCAWQLEVYAGNTHVFGRLIEGAGGRDWQTLAVDLSAFRGREIELRVYQRTQLAGRAAGNAYWRRLAPR